MRATTLDRDRQEKAVIYEGYYCQSESEEEYCGRVSCLSDLLPIKYTYTLHWIDETEEVLVPPDDSAIVVDDLKIWHHLTPGKRYRITVEEIE